MNKFIAFYASLFVADVLFAIFTPTLTYISKPLIVSSLLGLYIVTVEKQNRWYIFFLIFEMLSQVFFVFYKNDTSLTFSKASTILSCLCFIGLTYPAFKGFTQPNQKILLLISSILFIVQFLLYYTELEITDFLIYLNLIVLAAAVFFGLGISQRFPTLLTNSYISLGILLLAIAKLITSEGDINVVNFLGSTLYATGHLLIGLGLIKIYQKAKAAYEKANNLPATKR